jgi:hypothetical protein
MGTSVSPGQRAMVGTFAFDGEEPKTVRARGLHPSTVQLNLSAFYGIGGALRGCVARVKGVSGGL